MSEAVRVWDVRTGEMKRAFPGGETNVKTWPYFKWVSVCQCAPCGSINQWEAFAGGTTMTSTSLASKQTWFLCLKQRYN